MFYVPTTTRTTRSRKMKQNDFDENQIPPLSISQLEVGSRALNERTNVVVAFSTFSVALGKKSRRKLTRSL